MMVMISQINRPIKVSEIIIANMKGAQDITFKLTQFQLYIYI